MFCNMFTFQSLGHNDNEDGPKRSEMLKKGPEEEIYIIQSDLSHWMRSDPSPAFASCTGSISSCEDCYTTHGLLLGGGASVSK